MPIKTKKKKKEALKNLPVQASSNSKPSQRTSSSLKRKKTFKGKNMDTSNLPVPFSSLPKKASEMPASGSALKSYIHFISRFPLLTKEEEYKLAVEYYETKNPKAAEKLVQSNLRFVIKVVGEYSKFSSKIMDLIQEGNLGLIKAVKEFNPYKEVRLITYAVWWIKGYIQEYLIRHHSIVRLGTNKKEKALYYLLQREKDALDQMTHRKLLPEISRYTKTPLKELEIMKQRVFYRDVSLNQPLKTDSSSSLLDFQEDKTQNNLEEKISDAQQATYIRKILKQIEPDLTEKEKKILHQRLLKPQPDTLQQIADIFKVTREAIRQSEERLMEKLRKKLIPLLKKPY